MHTLAPKRGLLAHRLCNPLWVGSSCDWCVRLFSCSTRFSAEQSPGFLYPSVRHRARHMLHTKQNFADQIHARLSPAQLALIAPLCPTRWASGFRAIFLAPGWCLSAPGRLFQSPKKQLSPEPAEVRRRRAHARRGSRLRLWPEATADPPSVGSRMGAP